MMIDPVIAQTCLARRTVGCQDYSHPHPDPTSNLFHLAEIEFCGLKSRIKALVTGTVKSRLFDRARRTQGLLRASDSLMLAAAP